MHYNHMFISTDWLLLDRIVRPHLGGDALLYSVSIGMSVGSLLSANMDLWWRSYVWMLID